MMTLLRTLAKRRSVDFYPRRKTQGCSYSSAEPQWQKIRAETKAAVTKKGLSQFSIWYLKIRVKMA